MTAKLPKTDSIQELASFWESHDLTEFDDQIEEVAEPIFQRKEALIHVPLTAAQASALEELARCQGVDSVALIQGWIRENVRTSS